MGFGMLIIVLLFIIFGLTLYSGKGAFLIAGFNTLPEEEKEKYDEIALCKFMGKAMFALAFGVLLWAMSDFLKMDWLLIVGFIVFIIVIAFILFYVNTSNRFRK